MKIKNIILCDKVEDINNLIKINLDTTLYIEEYPTERTFSIVAFIEEFKLENNRFKIRILDKRKVELITGGYFRAEKVNKNGLALLTHDVYLNFETEKDNYFIQLINEEKVLEELKVDSTMNMNKNDININSIQEINF